jgi:hypothetical protein
VEKKFLYQLLVNLKANLFDKEFLDLILVPELAENRRESFNK